MSVARCAEIRCAHLGANAILALFEGKVPERDDWGAMCIQIYIYIYISQTALHTVTDQR